METSKKMPTYFVWDFVHVQCIPYPLSTDHKSSSDKKSSSSDTYQKQSNNKNKKRGRKRRADISDDNEAEDTQTDDDTTSSASPAAGQAAEEKMSLSKLSLIFFDEVRELSWLMNITGLQYLSPQQEAIYRLALYCR